MLTRRIASFGLSAVLAVSLCPVPAFASVDNGLAVGSPALQAQASTKTVYVLKSITETRQPGSGYDKVVHKFTYAGNGLVKKEVVDNYYGSKVSTTNTNTWAYSGTNLKKKTESADYLQSHAWVRGPFTTTFTYKNGKRVKSVVKGARDTKETNTYTYKNGNVSKVKRVTVGRDGERQTLFTEKRNISYTYKGGRLVKSVDKLDSSSAYSATEYYKYDKKGNVSQTTGGTYSHFYGSHGKMPETSVVKTSPNSSQVNVKYTYKKVKVKSSLAAKVQAQQWAFVNGNLNWAIG